MTNTLGDKAVRSKKLQRRLAKRKMFINMTDKEIAIRFEEQKSVWRKPLPAKADIVKIRDLRRETYDFAKANDATPGQIGSIRKAFCSAGYYSKKPTPEYNFQIENPLLAKQWHQTKNDNLAPTDVLPHSHKKVWWVCGEGHEWLASVANRSKGSGCPYCFGREPKGVDT